ncbi:MAG: transglycosylase SLT domain-containing protein [Bdellovibrionales bacterium]|nr:transglycosylase SLT domain-containing protein [Bdellovibrionales bacterium]
MRFVLLYICTIFLIVSCANSTKEILPPTTLEHLPPTLETTGDMDKESLDLQLLGIAAKYPDKTTRWWVNYKRARIWETERPGVSCPLYMELAQTRQFPLQQVALLRAFAACEGADLRFLPKKQVVPEEFPEWMRALATEIALGKARRDGDQRTHLQLAYEKSKQNLPPQEKVELTKEALKLAQQLADGDMIKTLQARLIKLAPKFKVNPPPSEYLEVAFDFRRYREFNEARKYYQKVLSGPRFSYADKVVALKGIRTVFKLERKKPEYLQATVDLASYIETAWRKRKKPPFALTDEYHESEILLARTHWTLGQAATAQKILARLSQTLKGKHNLSEVFWLRGRMAEETGQYQEAIDWFDQGLAELKGKNGSLGEKISWYRAWNLRKLRKFEEAKVAMEKLKSAADNEFSRFRYSFWLAMTLKNLGQSDPARLELESLTKEDPLGYYGLLAYRELGRPVTVEGLNKSALHEEPEISPKFRGLLERPYVEWLLAVGESQIANDYLDHIADGYRKRENQDEATWVGLFRYYAKSGIYLSLYNQLGKLEPLQRNSILNRYPELVFPTPYKDLVSSSSNRYGVSAELIYAIMRQESAFNPAARSPADAFGLMQLLPEVAQRTAQENQVDFKKDIELYEPHINIPIGSAYLRELWDRFNGQFILTVASYNASEDAIFTWLRTRFRGDTLEFIEDIPYEETRGYVRLVMRNLVFYNLMISGKPTIPFPEWCLALTAPSTTSQ